MLCDMTICVWNALTSLVIKIVVNQTVLTIRSSSCSSRFRRFRRSILLLMRRRHGDGSKWVPRKTGRLTL